MAWPRQLLARSRRDLARHTTEAIGSGAHRAFVPTRVGRDAFECDGVYDGIIAWTTEQRGQAFFLADAGKDLCA